MSRAGLALGAGTVAAALTALLLAALAPGLAFVFQSEDPAWIAAQVPVSTGSVQTRDDGGQVEFRRGFELDAPSSLELRVESLGRLELSVDGRVLASRDQPSRRPLVVTDTTLAAGAHELRVRVANPDGPALLRLLATGRAEPGGGRPLRIASDARFTAHRPDEAPRAARLADDRLRAPEARTGPVVAQALGRLSTLLLGLAALGALAFVWLSGEGAGRLRARLPLALGLAILLYWGWLGFVKFPAIASFVGFDGPGHLAYVDWVRSHRALPMAHEGAQFYQAPLYYVLQAGVSGLVGDGEAWRRRSLHLLPWLCGLVQVAATFGMACRLFPADRRRAAIAAGFAAVLPLNVYMSGYTSNETLYGALGALCLWATAFVITAPAVSLAGWVGVGALAGLALLTKSSGLLVLGLCAFFVALRSWLVDRAPGRAFAAAATLGGVGLLVGGGWLLRNQLHYGRALFSNWGIPGHEVAGFQQPGFHTAAYYLSFGSALSRPFFASFESFWDGLYSTFWGDGLAAGLNAWRLRPAHWDWDWMAVSYPLALPATLLVGVGLGALARRAARPGTVRLRLASAFAFVAAGAVLWTTLVLSMGLPAYSMAHARYLLVAIPIFSVAGAHGFVLAADALPGRAGTLARGALHVWAFVLVACFVQAFR